MKRVFATAAAVLFAALTLASCMFLPPHAAALQAGGNAGDPGAAADPRRTERLPGASSAQGKPASEAGAASAAPGDDGYVAEANRIAMEFVDGPTGRYLKGELSEDAFKAEPPPRGTPSWITRGRRSRRSASRARSWRS